MKRTYLLLLLAVFSLPLSISSNASARLYDARLMGVDAEAAILEDLSDVEEVKMCLPNAEQLSDDDDQPAPQKRDVPAPSGPMF